MATISGQIPGFGARASTGWGPSTGGAEHSDSRKVLPEAARTSMSVMANDHQPVPFGIGCIYFALNERANSSWEDAVMGTLSSIPGVSGVEIDLGVVLPQEAQARAGYYPTRGMLRFSLHVPKDGQRELQIPGAFQSRWEHFIVFIYFHYFEPVTFVMPYGATSASDAAPAVLVVRRYLQEQFSRQACMVDLRVVGPSPFHVESCIKPGRTSESFSLSRVPSQGYEEFAFLYSRKRFSSSALAAVHLFKGISEEHFFRSIAAGSLYVVVSRDSATFDSLAP
jgi:hypothetical protein